jgi:putative membrane-bound dehydrogenase-like protein
MNGFIRVFSFLVCGLGCMLSSASEPAIKVLFLGDQGHHSPAERFSQLEPVLRPRGIEMTYSERITDLAPESLARYDVLAVYANIADLSAAHEAAIVEFVRGGKGLVPLHCASWSFNRSPVWIDLVGAQFQKHGTGVFRTVNVAPEHPVMRGFGGFESWDETYVHAKHNDRGRTILEERVDGDHREPWTWVRTEGLGRVFYTAWGHDHRTWAHPGFHNLVERGVRFAAGRDPAAAGPYADRPTMTKPPADVRPFEYQPAKVPFYDPDAKQWGKTLEPLATMQKPLPAAESLKHAITPVGFRVEMHAAEPLLEGKPLAMAFDGDGRLFVAESVDYPNELVEPGQGDGRDRIVSILDADGDGRADRRTLFADKLSIPTSMLAHDGGLLVAQAPHLLYLRDTDGDGRADERRVVFSGWGINDTHAGPSNLTWGMDGWVYGIVGYAGFNGKVGEDQHRFGAGFFRFRPDGSKLEFLRSTNNNSWGLGFSEEGLLFGSTANRNPSEHMPLPNRVYERVRGWSATTLRGIAGSPKMELAPRGEGRTVPIRQVDHHGGFTAAAGHRLYTARAYPREYWNRTAFVAEPTGHIVATFQLTPSGAGFSSRMAGNLLASDDEWTAPIQAEVGPDGQVWVIDWYNFIVQHNPTPAGFETGRRAAYVTPLRDKTHGRVWRVVHGGSPVAAPKSPADASPEELIAMLGDTNMFWRERAQRKIVERAAGRPDGGRDVVPPLVRLVGNTSVDAIGLNPGAIHALWTLRQLGVLDGPHADTAAIAAVHAALCHPSAGVRMNAVRVLPRDAATPDRLAASGAPRDSSPLVRLAVLDAIGESAPGPAAAAIVMGMILDPATLADPVLADAATAAAAVQAPDVLPKLLAGKDIVNRPRWQRLVERVAEHVARGADGTVLVRTLKALGEAPADIAAAAVTGMSRGWPVGTPAALDAEANAAVAAAVETLPAEAKARLLILVRHAGSKLLDDRVGQVAAALLAEIDRSDIADESRLAAAEQFVAIQPADRAVLDAVLSRAEGGRISPQLCAGLFAVASRSTAPGAAAAVLDRLPVLTPQVREAAVRTILANRDWACTLVDGLESGTVRLGDIPLTERGKLTEHPDPQVRERARKVVAAGGGLPNADRQKVIDEILPSVQAGGDLARGKALFREQCGKCHVHSGEGGMVGPELTGMAVHPAHELLIHILDPNRSVEGNYRAYTVVFGDGRVVTGLLAAESRTAIEIVDAEGKRWVIQRGEIEEFTASPNSLMPVGFEKQITPEGFADLLTFLTTRPVPGAR